ncbi:unnamed protein product [Tilletia controversa]|uniref:VPS9 domain-containing protein n=3 Tax=Tilletia TaxID=13289 RepID=A0A8X7SZC1_9BASI|nr:hypothetical protein CF328_g2198 [Tilletia controversa]KAE8206838.1 hypothetical protein CF335_g1576 [Tilletia laevis]KAE8264379.1 hypothetical protein A4X03_0g990 [Tilletia caries]KAE8252901.1 hypothetical protein A4X06_0g1844 [Tilletia controversa]CAD6884165.1 unnamed protein product [Tilletia caries]
MSEPESLAELASAPTKATSSSSVAPSKAVHDDNQAGEPATADDQPEEHESASNEKVEGAEAQAEEQGGEPDVLVAATGPGAASTAEDGPTQGADPQTTSALDTAVEASRNAVESSADAVPVPLETRLEQLAASSADPAPPAAGSGSGPEGPSTPPPRPEANDINALDSLLAASSINSPEYSDPLGAQERKPNPLPKVPDSPAPSVPSKMSTPFKKAHRFSTLPVRQDSLPPPPPPEKPAADEVGLLAQGLGRELSPARTPSPRSVDKALPPMIDEPSSSTAAGTLSAVAPVTPAPASVSASAPTELSRTSGLASPRLTSPSGVGIRVENSPPSAAQPPAAEEPVFDFNRFLEQMRHRSATPVGEYVRSFIRGFSKKPYRPADQIRLIFDFLAFITDKMKEAEVWATSTPAEFENATEAMEKLIMNRLYNLTFTPAVAREGKWPVQTDDLERDRIIKDRILLFSWVRPEHLDIPVGEHTAGFVEFAAQELLKMNNYKAPRDKLICILNCCKVIFGMIRHMSTTESADSFVPALIYVVLKANPDNLVSNVEYISRFRSPERLSSESGYYLSSLAGAVSFVESMDNTSLTGVTQEDMERNVDAAVTALALAAPPSPPEHGRSTISLSGTSSPFGEEGARTLQSLGPIAASLADDTRMFLQRTGEAARAGFAGGLGKPIGVLGKLFNEGLDGVRSTSPSGGNGSRDSQLGGPGGSGGR